MILFYNFVFMKNYISKITKSWLSIFGGVSFILLLVFLEVLPTAWVIGISWYGSGNDYTNPVTTFSGSVTVGTWETLTGTTQVTLTQPVEVKNSTVSVVIPTGTIITQSSGTSFNATQIATSVLPSLPISLPSNEEDVGKIQFWISGTKLNFSKPVKLQIPVTTTAGTVKIKAKHAWVDGYQTFALSDTLAANCFNGFATPSSSTAVVSNGIATIYTCSASEFVAVTDKVVTPSQPSRSWGWGWWSNLLKDNCSSGDFSPSYYDKTCGNVPGVITDESLKQVTKELSDMVISMKGTGAISNTTKNEQIRFKYIVESKVQTAKYFGYDIKYIPSYDLSKNTTKFSMAIINNTTLVFADKQRYVDIVNEFLVARYNYELAQTKHQILRNKYNKQTILLNNLAKKLSK